MGNLLTRTPEEAARLIALGLLARCRDAAARLGDPGDEEALHDFRVSVRRLRSVLKAYAAPLRGSLRKRHRRGLSSLASATGEGRDAEVALAWVAAQAGEAMAEERTGVDWLVDRLEARRGAGYEAAREALAADFAPLADDLAERLSVYSRRVRLGDAEGRTSFGELISDTGADDLERLARRLAAIDAGDDGRRSHEARLAAKRLRYLLEPLAEELTVVEPILERLKKLQDLLGETHDAHVLEREISEAVDAASRERGRASLAGALAGGAPAAPAEGERESKPRRDGETGGDPLPGLLALARRNRRRREDLFARLAADWLGADAGERRALEREVGSLSRWLASGFSPPPPEDAASGRAPAP